MAEGHPVTRIPWRSIEPLSTQDVPPNGVLGALDALRNEWERRLKGLDEAERTEVRRRSLRRLAIETGIIERLYDVDWGLTLTLVAEGFSRDVIERAGGQIDERTLATLRAQLDSLSMVGDFVRSDRALSTSFIRELHHAITRTQDTYIVTDSLGRVVETALPKGEWKVSPNSVVRQDNTLLEYAPPEQVASEMDRLISLWNELDSRSVHPLVKTAWLHHRFVSIHPFADGNGRVARALTLLVLEKHRYAPLVVDRWHRSDYLRALDAANEGCLDPLIRLFAKLESAALAGELERPFDIPSRSLSVDVAHTLADQLAEMRRRKESEIQQRLSARAVAVGGRIRVWFDRKRQELEAVFKQRGLSDVKMFVNAELPPSEKSHWFRRQVEQSAHTAGHFANLGALSGWCSLRIRLEPVTLRYVASLHGAGRDIGVMAVTTFGELLSRNEPAEERDGPEHIQTTKDAFRFVHTEGVDDLNKRSAELEELLDEGLAEALVQLLKRS